MKRRNRTRRQRLEAAIERAIEALNAMDGDPDDEPALGSITCIGVFTCPIHAKPIYGSYDQTPWASGANDEREQDAGDEGEAVDYRV